MEAPGVRTSRHGLLDLGLDPDIVTVKPMNAGRGGYSLMRLLRAFAWCLCALVAVSMAGSRLLLPAAAALISSYTGARSQDVDAGAACEDAVCNPSETDDTEQHAESDQGSEEVPTVPDVRIIFARAATSELTIAYTGKPHPGYSSPDSRPAEQI